MLIVAILATLFVIGLNLAVGVSVVAMSVKGRLGGIQLDLSNNATNKETPIPEHQKHLQMGDWKICPSKVYLSKGEGGQGNLMSKVRS